jgi:hypothetical protein
MTCGGDLAFATGMTTTAKCIYCGSHYALEEDPDRGGSGKKLASLLMLAEECEKEGKKKEAGKYYSRVIERDPRNVGAWIGRGLTQEPYAVNCFQKAIALAADKEAVEKTIVHELVIRSQTWDFGGVPIPPVDIGLQILTLVPENRIGAIALLKTDEMHFFHPTDLDRLRRSVEITDRDPQVVAFVTNRVMELLTRKENANLQRMETHPDIRQLLKGFCEEIGIWPEIDRFIANYADGAARNAARQLGIGRKNYKQALATSRWQDVRDTFPFVCFFAVLIACPIGALLGGLLTRSWSGVRLWCVVSCAAAALLCFIFCWLWFVIFGLR